MDNFLRIKSYYRILESVDGTQRAPIFYLNEAQMNKFFTPSAIRKLIDPLTHIKY